MFLLLAGFLCGCAKDPVSGWPTLSMISEKQEVELGREYDAQVVAEYGLYDDQDLAAYVDELGQSLAAVSQRPDLEYHFRVLDDGVVNAFALPGGYVYMPRGILAYFNSEDQLAGIMGHETGHVVARHSVEQMSKRILVTGFGTTDRLAKRFPIIGGLATAPINLGLLKYSRDQESESDRLGVEYATRTGYDAHAMADFFRVLDAMSEQSGHSLPTYLSTHPHPDDRYEKVNKLADEWQSKIPYTPRPADPGAYLKRIDGIVYGRDPRLGFVAEGVFYHPSIGFQFPIPPKWELTNTASRVLVVAPDEKALVTMSLATGTSAAKAADEFLASEELKLIDRRKQKVNGLPAVVIEAVYVKGSQRTRVLSQFVERGGKVLAFHGLAAEEDYPTRGDDISDLLEGVAPIKSRAILNVQPRRVHVTRAPAAGDVQSILRNLGVAQDELQEIANMNGRDLRDRVDKGDWIKVVR
jgi:predicted Zn-dependent protease